MMDFHERVYEVVRRIPYGQVATYGQVAAAVSFPRAARMVGSALRALPEKSDVPWHRVIGSKGIITIENMEHPAEEQANMLMAEGVAVSIQDGEYAVDLSRYLWKVEKQV